MELPYLPLLTFSFLPTVVFLLIFCLCHKIYSKCLVTVIKCHMFESVMVLLGMKTPVYFADEDLLDFNESALVKSCVNIFIVSCIKY